MRNTVILLFSMACGFYTPVFGTGSNDSDRYIINDGVLIRTLTGHTLSAVVVRRKDLPGQQPAALLFYIYSNTEQSIREASLAADHGYVGVVADVRGKRLSPEEVMPYENEQEDVNEVIDWISKQPWSDGKVGMYGGSYSGFAQWAGMKHKVHPALKTIVPYVAGIPGQGLPMENNVFINANYEWAFYVGNNKYTDDAANNDRQRWREMNRDWYRIGSCIPEDRSRGRATESLFAKVAATPYLRCLLAGNGAVSGRIFKNQHPCSRFRRVF